MVRMENIVLRYGGPLGRGIGPLSLEVNAGECLGLLGPSGCGKSTLLRVIAGLLPRLGLDHFSGGLGWADGEKAENRRVSLMFQQTVLLPHMNVIENVLLPFLGRPEVHATSVEDAERLLVEVGIGGERDLLPEELSGGMRTRVALARALVVRPKVLLLDEPFSGLDVGIRESAYQVIEKSQKQNGSTVVFVSHDLEEAWRLCGRVVVMNTPATAFTEIAHVRDGSFREFRAEVLSAMKNGHSS